jgi:CRISPR-associated helicase Cas3/CRISPR-associated endonuclease Cas3-HD
MSRNYFAHTGGDSKTSWQSLQDHLVNVSNLSGSFAGAFNAGDIGSFLGLLHDIGKYSDAFQRRLEGNPARVDHSTAGAQIASGKYGILGWLMAYIISGHHGGLPNGYTLENDRIPKTVPDYSAWLREITLPELNSRPLFKVVEDPNGFSLVFFIRMLFSCLVDADWSDTARFVNGIVPHDPTTPDVLEPILEAHLNSLAHSSADTPVNRIRREVLDQCRAAADNAPGWFTLTVPTGGGKTLSSLAFALRHAKRNQLRRVIYGIPFTSIIEQNAEVFRRIFGEDHVLEHHSHVIPPAVTDGDETEHPVRMTENWDMPLVVTTNVQLLESLFSNKPAQCRKLHNIAGSVIILDEAQTLPAPLLKPTLRALKELVVNYGCSVVLCTATQPALGGVWSNGLQTREIITDTDHLFRSLKRVQAEKTGSLSDEELTRRIAEEPQCLCIVNSRRHARELYLRLAEQGDVWHLSTLMYPAHRSRAIREIREALRLGKPCRVISTQLIEAGVDIDFPVVFRAMAGLDSIAQAAGRCNREGRLDTGRLFVFESNEHHPIGWLSKTASYGSAIYRISDDILSPDSIQCYFHNLYTSEKDNMGQSIMRKHELQSARPMIEFPEIAQAYRIIEDNTHAVFIETEKSASLIAHLMNNPKDMLALRRLQQYGVSIYDNEYRRLHNAVMIEEIFPFGPMKLINQALYHPVTGLQVEDPYLLNNNQLSI